MTCYSKNPTGEHSCESYNATPYEAAISTPWRQRIRSSVLVYERNLFELWRRMPEHAASERFSATA